MSALGTIRSENIPPEIKLKKLSGIEEIQFSKLIELGKDTSKLHLIVDMQRIGAGLFNVKMEYTHFPPRSEKNTLFEMVMLRWPTQNDFLWAVSSFPIEYRSKAEEIAKECGLRIADGIPTVFNFDGAHQFPLSGSTAFTLENIAGHKVYNNDLDVTKKLKKQEHDQIDEIINADRIKIYEEMKEKGYSNEQIDRILSQWDEGNEEYDETPQILSDGQHRHGNIK
jgi:hypothetical protein